MGSQHLKALKLLCTCVCKLPVSAIRPLRPITCAASPILSAAPLVITAWRHLQVAVAWLRGPPGGPNRMPLLGALADQVGIAPEALQSFMRTCGSPVLGGGNPSSNSGNGGSGNGNGGGGGPTLNLLGGDQPGSLDASSLPLSSLPLLQLLPPGQLQQLSVGGGPGASAAAQLLLAQGGKGNGAAANALRGLLDGADERVGVGGGAGANAAAALAQRLGGLAGLRPDFDDGGASGLANQLMNVAAASGRGKRQRSDDLGPGGPGGWDGQGAWTACGPFTLTVTLAALHVQLHGTLSSRCRVRLRHGTTAVAVALGPHPALPPDPRHLSFLTTV